MPISPIANGQRAGGFTLIELMLAITIGSVVMTAVYLTFNTAVGSQQRIQRAAEASQASRFFMELMRSDLKNLAAKPESLTGNSERLSLLSMGPDGKPQTVSYSHDSRRSSDQVIRLVETEGDTSETVAYENVQNVTFRFLINGTWHTQASQSVLPQAVECALEIGGWVQRFTVTIEVENVPIQS